MKGSKSLHYCSYTWAQQQYRSKTSVWYTGAHVQLQRFPCRWALIEEPQLLSHKTKVKKGPFAKLIASGQRAGDLKFRYFFCIAEFSTASSVSEPFFLLILTWGVQIAGVFEVFCVGGGVCLFWCFCLVCLGFLLLLVGWFSGVFFWSGQILVVPNEKV